LLVKLYGTVKTVFFSSTCVVAWDAAMSAMKYW
jgi:hypothetical protein